jgi:hypothetical protein
VRVDRRGLLPLCAALPIVLTGSGSMSGTFAAVERSAIAQGTLTGLVTHQP